MSGRGRPRKVRDENPGSPVAKSPQVTRKKSAPKETKTKNAIANCLSKLPESQEVCTRKSTSDANSCVQTPKQTLSSRKKVAAGSSTRTDNGVEDLPRAPEKVKKSQSSESDATEDAKVSCCPPKRQESKNVRPKKSAQDANTTAETHALKTSKSSDRENGPNRTARRGNSVDDTNPNKVLHTALEKLKVKKSQRSESAKCVNELQSKITEYLKLHLDWCRDISVLKSGSYYENLKILSPDEFDFMLTVRVERVNLQAFQGDGAFYSVEMKRRPLTHPLKKFVKDDIIMASEMLKEFREKIKEAVEKLKLDNVSLDRKKMGCPAVTLHVKENSKDISIDLVLCLEVQSSWPSFTQDGFNIENWLSKKVRMEQRRKSFYLVPKYEGRGTTEQDGVMAKDAWRISFSHVEKYILKNHGNSKTCCEKEQKCCRKPCLKLLKYLLQRLKEEHVDEADKLCSYHAKTTLLHACAVRVKDSDWAESELSHCFQQLLTDFEKYLRACALPNFFIPSQNLFSGLNRKKCILLADFIETQRNNGFPLLK